MNTAIEIATINDGKGPFIFIMSTENFTRSFRSQLNGTVYVTMQKHLNLDLLIVDEAHKAKNHKR